MDDAVVVIGKRKVGQGYPCLVIAEIGPNHDGSVDRAKKLVDLAANCGCHGVKFQYHIADLEIADKQSIIPWSGEIRYDFVRNVQEFTENEHAQLKEWTQEKGLLYVVSPFNLKAVEVLDKIGVDAYKIASGEISNLELVKKCCLTGRPVILSSGMSTLDEIDKAIATARETGNANLILLQCTSEYPTQYEDMNLRTIVTFRHRYGILTGLSDHNLDPVPVIASVALGCCLIEKHFTDDKTRPGPDHAVSLEPHEMKALVAGVRNLEKALGDGAKNLGPNAEKLRRTFMNSIVAAKRIPEGTIVAKDHFCLKKPGTGLPPEDMKKLIGMKAKRNIEADTIVSMTDFSEV